MAKQNAEKSKSRGPSTFKLFLAVLILLLVPTTMEQLSMHEDTVRLVGRVCVGVGILFFAYGLFSKVMRFTGIVLLVLIVARVLANEGVIHVPKLLPKLEEAREKNR
jgi:drug/metabolite transporter (DMT)-like permease